MFLLDTNVISELRRPDRANSNVVAWANSRPHENFFLSVISILEIEQGTLLIARRDAAQAVVLRHWIDTQIIPLFSHRILSFDIAAARCCAQLHIPNPRAERDAMIAATAIAHQLIVVTRNRSDFQAMGVELINPWNEPLP